jgi:branched-subunit amino acid ABC-type transport system permease component
MSLLQTILFDGITYASWLFVVALGLTLVFGVLKILNIAHGSFYAIGAYAGASLVGLGLVHEGLARTGCGGLGAWPPWAWPPWSRP